MLTDTTAQCEGSGGWGCVGDSCERAAWQPAFREARWQLVRAARVLMIRGIINRREFCHRPKNGLIAREVTAKP